ncbi:MAG: tetratricopeptide repeat protein [Nitrospinota bacterium]
MQCPRCQQENPSGAKFCNACGARLEVICPGCAHANVPGSRYCNQCGAVLEPAAAPAPATRFASPQAYTPKHLAEKILTSKSALEGERKQVTVLFADLKGSLELLADRDPEEARTLLDPVLGRMMEAVHRYEGTVNQVMGDGLMSLFGAPLAHEDHALRACYAALAMQGAIRGYSEEVRRSHGVEVRIRIGLNSGEVVVRAIGNDLHMDYTAVGQTTHLAARMEQLAPPGSIRLTGETLRLAEGFVQVQPLGPVPVKGLAEPVEAFELAGAAPTRTRFQAAAARGLTRFVGRQNELDALQQALDEAGEGHGQLLAVVGEAGVGKSRLFWEFTHSHRTKEWLIVESGSVSYGKASAYLPVIDLLKAYFRIEDADDHRRIREKVTGKVLTLDESLTPAIPPILALLEVPVEDPGWQNLDPPQRRQRTLDGLKRLLLRESQVQSLVVVFEDLHWIDSETQALLNGLVESLPGARILLLVNYRPGYDHGWAKKTYYTRLRLDPLPAESAKELLRALLGEDPGLEPLKKLLMERTEGNPFFLEESVRTLVEMGALEGTAGSYRLAKEITAIRVPATVQAVLAARMDRLEPEEKRLLQTASVIGTHVPFPLLSAIAEMSEEDLHRGLSSLQAAEFLYETSLFPDLEYTFKHALTQEVAYGSLLHERRRAIHARVVDAIETLYADRQVEQVERLAHHAFRGEVWDKAVTYFRQAGQKAASRSAHREAVVCFEQALDALKHLPERRETMEEAIDLRFDLRNSLVPLGEFGRAIDHLREAEILAKTLDDQRRLGLVSDNMAAYFWVTGEPESALEFGHRTLAIAETLGDLRLQAVAVWRLGRVYEALGNYPRALDFLRTAVAALEGDLSRERLGQIGFPSVISRMGLVNCLSERGGFTEGLARGEEAIRIAQAVDSPFSLIGAYDSVGVLHLRKGDFGKAIPVLERGLALCQVADIRTWFPWVASALGYAYALGGRVAEGLLLLEQAVERAASIGLMSYHSLRLAWLSEAHLLAGRIDEAIQLARRALDLSRDHKERGSQAYALRLLGEVASHRDPPDAGRAEDHYRQALARAEELGMRLLVAHCHFGLGSLYGQMGRAEQARTELSAAIELYRVMEMPFWLTRAEAALANMG